MEVHNDNLHKRMEIYPLLTEVLGRKWIAQQKHIHPLRSEFQLARWLVLDGYEDDLATLERVLGELWDVPHMADRRKRIRNDSKGFLETLTELYFAAWLHSRGNRFDLPKEGADFCIHLDNGVSLPIEVTTPRREHLAMELYDRLRIISKYTGYRCEITVDNRVSIDDLVSKDVASEIATEAWEGIERTNSEGNRIELEQSFDDYGVRIKWMLDSGPWVKVITYPRNYSLQQFFNIVAESAKKKSNQLSESRSGILLIGIQNLSHDLRDIFDDAIYFYSDEDFDFDWTRVPKGVNHIVIYGMDYKSVKPGKAFLITTQDRLLYERPEIQRFLYDLFPDHIIR